MKIIHFLLLFITLGFFPCNYFCQNNHERQELSKLLKNIKNEHRLAYKQLIILKHENGLRDSLQTEMACDLNQKYLYAKNVNYYIVLNNKYFTRIDHLEKTVSVFDIERYAKEIGMNVKNMDFFDSDFMISSLDSLIGFRLNTISRTQDGNIVKYKVKFPLGYYIDKIEITYNNLLHMIVEYHIAARVFYGSTSQSYEILMFDYTRNFSDDLFSAENYIEIRGKEVFLRKYKDYELTKLL